MSDMICYIPAYNNSADVLKSLASVPDWRVVISDNGSSSPHREALAAVADSRVQVIHHEVSLGRVGNWRFCVEHFLQQNATWLKFLFAGDVLLPHAQQVFAAAAAANPTALTIIGAVEVVYPDNRRVMIRQQPGLCPSPVCFGMAAQHGNIFGGPIAGLHHQAGLRKGYSFGDGLLAFAADFWFSLSQIHHGPAYFMTEQIGEFHVSSRQYFTAKKSSLQNLLEDGLMRQYAVEAYFQLTNDRPGRDQLLAQVLRYVRERSARDDAELLR